MPKKKNATTKTATSVRIRPANLKRLQDLAKQTGKTVSKYIDEAVDEYLDREPLDRMTKSALSATPSGEFFIDLDDLERVTPVVKSMGKRLGLRLFISLVDALRAK